MKNKIKDDWVIKGLKEKIEKIDNAMQFKENKMPFMYLIHWIATIIDAIYTFRVIFDGIERFKECWTIYRYDCLKSKAGIYQHKALMYEKKCYETRIKALRQRDKLTSGL